MAKGSKHMTLPGSVMSDTQMLDWLQSLLDNGQQLFIDREELIPDDKDGPSFMGVSISIGPSGRFTKFAGGAVGLRDAILDARDKQRPNKRRTKLRRSGASERSGGGR